MLIVCVFLIRSYPTRCPRVSTLLSQALREWELWGPLMFTVLLASILAWGAKNSEKTFALVFALISIGAVVLTVNVMLLGGQSADFLDTATRPEP